MCVHLCLLLLLELLCKPRTQAGKRGEETWTGKGGGGEEREPPGLPPPPPHTPFSRGMAGEEVGRGG